MTFNEKGLIRAMKAAYKEYGYTVAATDFGYIITGEMWGVSIHDKAIPNTVKGLIVTHAGKLPDVGNAINVKKGETSSSPPVRTILNSSARARSASRTVM